MTRGPPRATQAAAARVVGYEQTSVKGRAVTQEPVPGVQDSSLPGLLEHALVYKELENRGALQGACVWGVGGRTPVLHSILWV